jgi:hypothetical protein
MAIFNSYVSLTEGKYIIGNMHSNRFVTYQPADQLFRLAKYTHSNVPAPASSKPQNVDHYWVQSVQNWANLWIYVDFQNPLVTGLTGSPRLCKENRLHPGISLPRLADGLHQLHLAWISISLAGGIVPGLPLFFFRNGDRSKPLYLVTPKIAGKCMFIPLKMVLIGIDP